MANTQAAKRYARALFDLARQENRSDAVCADIQAIGQLLQAGDLERFVGNYIIPSDRRVQTIRALFEGKVDALTLRFLLFLESKKRLGLLGGIASDISRLFDEQQGVLNVEITSATPLSAEQFSAIGRKLEEKFRKKIRATAATDARLLGGFVVQVGGTIYDYSIETQLQALNRTLASA